ncbi:quaternary ammonium compound efflux SMR transporter SugE [Gilvimarinus sp. DA14]|uniref:quaternary ammonium compound efflux SMR transporter SugE n=1 Tax=Gilvimarinus sp. DA14 TaxID=2956798 RepID=UPI0020B76BFF|nr:quaternary ammonium compound efflux SMR transporter SugE [Gilvimarinus sp. DA14]UTF59305.1 quaternary ammonium compound efflux SMR transporter SugE [Gilvimarinus sp. DA14]
MSWVFLLLAGLFEIIWATGLKYTDGFTRLWPSVITAVAIVLSLAMLGLSLRQLPLSTAYAIWSGIGAVGTVMIGTWIFGEHMSALRLGCIALILLGIIGLKLTN